MNNLRRMIAFARVVEAGSFSGAARQLGIARSAVSRHIALLEKSFGVRLLNRTTRRLSLTEAGRIYYESCTSILAEAEAATQRIHNLRDQPVGTLKVAGPNSFTSQLAKLIHAFMQQYPALRIELQLDDRVIDMVQEGIDISIRIGWLPDSAVVARRLCDSPRILCASPAYLERMGRPVTPTELTQHECIIFNRLPTPNQWAFMHNRHRKTVQVQVQGHLQTNSAIAVRELALDGAGIVLLSSFLVAEHIAAGRLERLLPDYDCGSAGVYAVSQERQYRQAGARLLVAFLAEQLERLV